MKFWSFVVISMLIVVGIDVKGQKEKFHVSGA